MSLGLLGNKIGMTQIFDESGNIIPVTILKVGPCIVTQVKTSEKDGYDSIQSGVIELGCFIGRSNSSEFNNNFINDLFNIFNQTINENIEQEFEDVKVTLTPEQFSQLKCEKISNDNVDRYCNKPCNICMDNYNVDEEITFLVCNHYFHTDCIKHWLCNEKVTCPVCRKDNR